MHNKKSKVNKHNPKNNQYFKMKNSCLENLIINKKINDIESFEAQEDLNGLG